MATDARWIRLRYPGRCRACGRDLGRGERALHDRAARSVSCDRCAGDVDVVSGSSIEAGTAGVSARREHDRRRLARERRSAAVARLQTPDHERAWATGARGEERVAARLEQHLEGTGVVLLHDRRIPSSRANIDHLAIGVGGITVIDAKNYTGKVRTESRGGLLRPRTEHLLIGGRDQTKLVDGVRRQIDLMTAELERHVQRVDVRGVLCMVNVAELPLFGQLHVRGIAIVGPRHAAKLAARPGALAPAEANRVATTIAQAFPPA